MCFPRQAWITLYKPFVFPDVAQLQNTVPEYPLDFIAVKDESTVYGCGNNRILLEYKKIVNKDDQDEHCFVRKITIGACKLVDPKTEKPTSYEIIMPVKIKTNISNPNRKTIKVIFSAAISSREPYLPAALRLFHLLSSHLSLIRSS